jgi:hypothetical protein
LNKPSNEEGEVQDRRDDPRLTESVTLFTFLGETCPLDKFERFLTFKVDPPPAIGAATYRRGGKDEIFLFCLNAASRSAGGKPLTTARTSGSGERRGGVDATKGCAFDLFFVFLSIYLLLEPLTDEFLDAYFLLSHFFLKFDPPELPRARPPPPGSPCGVNFFFIFAAAL